MVPTLLTLTMEIAILPYEQCPVHGTDELAIHSQDRHQWQIGLDIRRSLPEPLDSSSSVWEFDELSHATHLSKPLSSRTSSILFGNPQPFCHHPCSTGPAS